MQTFTVRDLREHTGELIHDAESGELSLITKHGRPVFLAVPFTEELLDKGLQMALSIKLFKDNVISLEKAAKLAGTDLESFIERLGKLGITAVDYSAEELKQELKNLD